MANIEEVQLPNGTVYQIVDNESGYVTEAEVDTKILNKADKTVVSYCSCSTAAATAQKEVVPPTGWTLDSGRIIAVKFVNTNTANNPTLKVGTADAKTIYYGSATVTTSDLFAGGEQDRVTLYMYDGTRFVWLGHSLDDNTTYEDMSAAELLAGTETAQRSVRADHLKTGIQNVVDAMGIQELKVSVEDLEEDVDSIQSTLSQELYEEHTTREGNYVTSNIVDVQNANFLTEGYYTIVKNHKQITVRIAGISSKANYDDWIIGLKNGYKPAKDEYFTYCLGTSTYHGHVTPEGYIRFYDLNTTDVLSATITFNIA